MQLKQLFIVPRFTFGLVSQVMVYAAVTFLQPTLALHLEQFGYSAVFIGFSFAIPTLIYASTSPIVYVLTHKLQKTAIIFYGYAVIVVAMLFIGPSLMLGFYNSSYLILLGLAIMGFGCGMIIIPILPDMIDAIEELYTDLDEEKLHNNISGLFIAF